MTEKIWLNNDWQFTETFTEGLLKKDYQRECAVVRIPHTVKETPYHYFDASLYQMVSGYRRVLKAPKEWEGKRIFITFLAVAHSAYVFLNGEQVAEHHNGYTAFSVELTGHLHYGEDNILAVKVDSRESQNIPPFGNIIDYMTYGGIYREVFLEVKESIRIKDLHLIPATPQGVILPQEIRTYRFLGRLGIEAELDQAGGRALFAEEFTHLSVKIQITEHKNQKMVSVSELPYRENMEIEIPDARLWDVTVPYLYDISVTLLQDGTEIDRVCDAFGFRRSEFREDGYHLNGRKLKIRGLNRHQSYAYVGYAMPASMQKLDAELLRFDLGVNAVRTSHYPQSQHFLRRCDELGLLVFTEIPGWQHIGNAEWKEQAVKNVEEMVLQYRNHPSIIIWGVRINESPDDDAFYIRTNALAHALDTERPTGGVRYLKKSHLLEDVYTFNDFSYEGTTNGCEKKSAVTSDLSKPYLITEYNGHMYPTKTFDAEEHRLEHALRHAAVVNAVRRERDIAGCIGWCMFDYNTHKDFGSGDRICYHGVMDMFRNPKLAAYLYASQQNRRPVLEISSSMDIGEHPAGNRGGVYIFTNADSVRMYRNDELIKEYTAQGAKYSALRHPPILIDDYVGDRMKQEEGFGEHQNMIVKAALNYIAQYGMNNIPLEIRMKLAQAMTVYKMKFEDAYELYGKYVGNWGGHATTFRFEAVKDGEVVRTKIKATTGYLTLDVRVDHTELKEAETYDVASVRIRVCDEYGNVQPFFNTPLPLSAEGAIEIIGPKQAQIAGGMGGTYVKTTGSTGEGRLTISLPEGYSFQEKWNETVVFSVTEA